MKDETFPLHRGRGGRRLAARYGTTEKNRTHCARVQNQFPQVILAPAVVRKSASQWMRSIRVPLCGDALGILETTTLRDNDYQAPFNTEAKPTIYNGIRFRSRLEARWAIFLDGMGYEWEYEKHPVNLANGGIYTPDFFLPRQSVFAEVKPDILTPYEREKLNTAVRVHPMLVFYGNPNFITYRLYIQGADGAESIRVRLEWDGSKWKQCDIGEPFSPDYHYAVELSNSAKMAGSGSDTMVVAERFRGATKRFDPIFRLARKVKAVEIETGKKASQEDLSHWFERLWDAEQTCLSDIGSREMCWIRFLSAYRTSKTPEGWGELLSAIRKAKSEPFPPESDLFTSDNLRLLVAVCRELQSRSYPEPFFISIRDGCRVLDTYDTQTATGAYYYLVLNKVLELDSKGTMASHKATRYRYVNFQP